MDDCLHAGSVLLHDLKRVCSGLSAVDDNRHLFFPCQAKLADEPFFLEIMLFFIPVIIQSDLPHSDDLIPIQQFRHPQELFLIQLTHLIRVHADRTVYERILFGQFHDLIPGCDRGSHIYDEPDPALFHAAEQFLSVCVKLFIVIVCMCIDYHFFPL